MLTLTRIQGINPLKPILAVTTPDGLAASHGEYQWTYAHRSYDLDWLNAGYCTKEKGRFLLRQQFHQRYWAWSLDELRALGVEQQRKVFVYVFHQWIDLNLK